MTDEQPRPVDVRRTTLMSDGSVAQHFRDGNGAWDTIVHAAGSMVANRYLEFVDYAEEA